MSAFIEDYLHKIDVSFKKKSKKDISLTYIMIISAIFSFAYMFWDKSETDNKTIQNRIEKIRTSIKVDKAYLSAFPQAVVDKLDREIKNTQIQLIDYKDKNNYIKNKIEAIASLIYDERTWGEYLNSISLNAKKYNIKISEFTNTKADNKQAFGHILDLNIKFSATYKNTLKFINALEKSELVVDIHGLDIEAKDKLETELKISVWGITY